MTTGRADDDAPTRVIELVVNLDDATGERVGALVQALLDAGALDAWATPIVMKKGRPGVTLSVLVREADREAMTGHLLRDSGSFGVRYRAWDRVVLERTRHESATRLGPVRLKAGAYDGEPVTVKPEFDDVVALAKAAGVSLTEAQRAADAAADALLVELRRTAASSGGPSDG